MTMELPRVHSGKVRELYDAGDGRLLMVASDRVSAFDVIMAEPIPDKGRVLTAMTSFWCDEMADVVPGTQIAADPAAIADGAGGAPRCPAGWAGRAVLVRRAEMLPLECIVRGYLAGQAYEEYGRAGTVHGTAMPAGPAAGQPARRADLHAPPPRRPRGTTSTSTSPPPSTWWAPRRPAPARDICLELYRRAAARCAAAGFVLADTKFELGYVDGVLSLCDEVCTPDSSRLWPADQVVPGETPPAFDKQPLRDWLAAQPWDRRPPPPPLPDEVTSAMSARYVAAYERVTGRSLDDWYGATP